MCKPTEEPTTRRVIIAGAGPAGLLLQALLHHRNKTISSSDNHPRSILYDVTLIESRQDLGQLNQDELQSHRSWMIGLAGHGLEAVRSVPTLYEEYLSIWSCPDLKNEEKVSLWEIQLIESSTDLKTQLIKDHTHYEIQLIEASNLLDI